MTVSLTDDEKDVILRLGRESNFEFVSQQIIDQLLTKGILYHRPSDNHLDFTNFGEEVLEALQDDIT